MATTERADRPMSAHRNLLALYLLDATLVICHEIDSAYWHEWDLFRIPGGATVFVALHLVLVPFVLFGLVALAKEHPSARAISAFVAVAGVGGALLHGAFLWSGDERFSTPFSVALIVAFGLSSAWLLFAVLFRGGWRSNSA